MIEKNELPILEYDPVSWEVLKPGNDNEGVRLPEKCLFAFLGDEVDKYAEQVKATVADHFITIDRLRPIYIIENQGEQLCLCRAPLGGPAAAQFMDALIVLGCRKFLAVGSCGTLVDIKENDFLIPARALRDEGTSYKYLPASRYVDLDPAAVEKIGQGLKEQGLPFELCTTWTTDGFFRETRDMVEYRRGEGCQVVEMECASMAAVAAKRGAEFGQLLYTADSLANVEAHDGRDWGRASQAKALHICLRIIHNF